MEVRLKSLPATIGQVTIPETFSVSQIVAVTGCFFKALMDKQGGDEERLCPHPSAELGNVFHSLLEESVKGIFNEKDTSVEALNALLDRLLENAQVKLKNNAKTAAYANLKQTMTPLAWERKRRSIIDTALEFINNIRHVQKSPSIKRNEGFSFKDARGNGRWAEVPIYVPTLRLKGRIDILERTANEIKIVDFKSGRIIDANGEIKPNIVLQLLIYGIMAQSLDPSACVSLVINDGTEHQVPFDHEISEHKKDWLRSIMGSLVPGTIAWAEEHEMVGPDCRWCRIRHCCTKYIRETPELWTRDIEWQLPMDTWGTLEALTPKRNELVDLTLSDASGRRVKVFNVKETHLEKLIVGTRLWLFELASSRAALSGNFWRHPLNFYEVGESDMSDRAWSLQVFVG